MKRREQLHTIINSNSIHDETVLDLLFLRNDLLDSVLIRFNLRVAEVDVKEMEKPKLMFKPDLFPKKRILKSPAIETSRDELDKALDVKTPSKLLDSESDLLEKLDLDDNDNSLNSEDLLNLDMDPDLQMQEVDDFLDSL